MNKFELLKLGILIFVTFCTTVVITFYTHNPKKHNENEFQNSQKIEPQNNPKDTQIAKPTESPEIFPSNLPDTPKKTPESKLPSSGYKQTTASFFWIGEAADENNAFIPNDKSAWDADWQNSYGGVDNPDDRCGYRPCAFTPNENPFYFALPYNDLDVNGNRKDSASKVPWFEAVKESKSVLKNHWAEIRYSDKVCYGQWEDVGPLEADDFAYVFGLAEAKNNFGVKAGIDISPALRDCLGMSTNDTVSWKFVNQSEVPGGPWKEIVTTSSVRW